MSDNDLDYSDRPSKLVARRIFIEALRRLRAFRSLTTYQYVGFGAVQFVGFDLIHRKLGVKDMISIEGNHKRVPRCHFNKPYKSIRIVEGTSSTVIPTLDWSRDTILWLDYTQRLRTDELADVANAMLAMAPGSVLAVTLNCNPEEDEDDRRDGLAHAVGTDNVPLGISGAKLGSWGLAKVQREILIGKIQQTLGARADGSAWQQILNINYRDGAKMQMIVGIVDHENIHAEVEKCRFADMDEVRDGADTIEIEIPTLTLRERQTLNAKLPAGTVTAFAGIPEKAVKSYARYYKWMEPAV